MVRRSSLVPCVGLFLLLLGACGGDDAPAADSKPPASGTATGGTSSPSTGQVQPNNPSTAPTLQMPASRFAISQEDLDTGYITDIPATFVLDVKNYGKTATFPSAQEGESLLTQWGYVGGYETGYSPEGRDVAVLNGAYFIKVEIHLFKDESGAKKAFEYFENRLKNGAQSVNSTPVGNQSSAWKTVSGKVRSSQVDAAYHRIVFRRGNMVAVVLTYGADPFMKVDRVRALAQIVDDKALGQKAAVEPTPTTNFTPAANTAPRTPTVAR